MQGGARIGLRILRRVPQTACDVVIDDLSVPLRATIKELERMIAAMPAPRSQKVAAGAAAPIPAIEPVVVAVAVEQSSPPALPIAEVVGGSGALSEEEGRLPSGTTTCDKCDGRHRTADCPHFPLPREPNDDDATATRGRRGRHQQRVGGGGCSCAIC